MDVYWGLAEAGFAEGVGRGEAVPGEGAGVVVVAPWCGGGGKAI